MTASSHCAWHVVGLHAMDGGGLGNAAGRAPFSPALGGEDQALAACEQCG